MFGVASTTLLMYHQWYHITGTIFRGGERGEVESITTTGTRSATCGDDEGNRRRLRLGHSDGQRPDHCCFQENLGGRRRS